MKSYILFSILFILCNNSHAQDTRTDSVSITFEVMVPESTPDNATIFWAGSLNHWDPGNKGTGFGAKEYAKPMQKKDGLWKIQLSSTKDDTVIYKYARGSIFSVEEQADFTYRPVRTIVFDEEKTLRDTVAAWHDRPPEALQDKWPSIPLVKTKKPVTSNGQLLNGSGTIVYDKAMGSHFYDTNTFNTKTNGIPEVIREHVFYFIKVSDAPDNTVLMLAGRTAKNAPWNVYVDQDNNNAIDADELVFTVQSDTVRNEWSGKVQIQTLKAKTAILDSVKLTIDHATNLPKGYNSSANPDAPDLLYRLPFKQRKATLNGGSFYLTTLFEMNFSRYFYLNVDRNDNDSLEVGSGSNEVSEINLTQMYRQQKFYIHPTFKLGDDFWEVATIDPEGTSIRLRPAKNASSKISIVKGKTAPAWNATTTDERPLGSASLKGKYVFIDFWGSWCGPCRQEIPMLKEVYKQFKSDDFEMVGFAYDSPAAFNKAMENYKLPWPQILDDRGEFSTKFLVRGYPTHYLIGPDGKVLETGADLHGEKLVQTLEKYLK